MMDFIQVDRAKCTRCGICVAVCPGDVIGMGHAGPQVVRDLCVSCGQCVAVCPQGAMDNAYTPLAGQEIRSKFADIDQASAAQFLRSRRSIRNYQSRNVSREKIRELLDIARMAPTACNSQGITYHVIDHPETLRQIAAVVIDWTERELAHSPAMAAAKYAPHMHRMVDAYCQTGEDVVLRSAPCVILALADSQYYAGGRDNTYISFAYLQLYATAMGLGTCWAGLLEYCAISGYQPLLSQLDLPADKRITSGMMVGYPQYSYQRLVDRQPLQISWQ